MERDVGISGGMIRLGQLLKLAGAADGGVEAKAMIASGGVRVNGEAETRRGRQLVPGDLVAVAGETLRVVAGEEDGHRVDRWRDRGRT